MIMLSRTLMPVLVSVGLSACAAPAPAPDAAGDASTARSSRSSGVAYRDVPMRILENGPMKVNVKDDPRLGSRAAKIAIVEFSDYQCFYCRDFHQRQFTQLKKEYIDTGVVQFIHKDLPLRTHRQSVPAVLAAHCAGAQGRFWDMRAALFANQDRLGQYLFLELARQLNLDAAKFSACLESQAYDQDLKQDVSAARMLGFTGTPSFLIGKIEGDTLTVMRRSRGALTFDMIAQEIEKLRQPAAVP